MEGSLFAVPDSTTPLRICVCVTSIHYDKLDFSRVLCETLKQLGHLPFQATDGQPQILESDVVILAGDARRFTRSVEILKKC